MLFRPIEPRGDIFEATHHALALCLLLPIAFFMVIGQAWIVYGQIFTVGLASAALVAAMQFYALLTQPIGWVYLGGILILTALLHFAFYGSLMTVLHRQKALSLINLLVGTTLLAGAAAAFMPVLLGYGSVMPKHRLPLFEDFAESFATYAVLLGIGALFEWVCIRTGSMPEAARP